MPDVEIDSTLDGGPPLVQMVTIRLTAPVSDDAMQSNLRGAVQVAVEDLAMDFPGLDVQFDVPTLDAAGLEHAAWRLWQRNPFGIRSRVREGEMGWLVADIIREYKSFDPAEKA